jgi:hypothetical protein
MEVMSSVTRIARHTELATELALLGDGELGELLAAGTPAGVGIGGRCTLVEVAGTLVFVKRVPLTDIESLPANARSTANVFDLPAACHYGTGRSPGFGAWRELVANQIVTEGVLAGDAASFPSLYHWRVLPGRPPIASEQQDIDAVVAQFGGDPAVRIRFEELAAATASLVLFLEHVADPLLDRLTDPVGQAGTLERQLFEIVAFLRSRELLHMDGHFGNIRADDERIYLVDFGLATSLRFDLSTAERDFAARNAGHDADYAAMRLVNWLVTTVCGVPVPAGHRPVDRNTYVRRCASGDLPRDVPAAVVDILARHAAAAARMNDFCGRLFDGDLDAAYPGA